MTRPRETWVRECAHGADSAELWVGAMHVEARA